MFQNEKQHFYEVRERPVLPIASCHIYIHVFVCVCVCVSMCVFVGDGYLLDLSCPSSAAAAARARCGGAADALKGAFTYYIPPTGGAERNHECSNIRPPITPSGWWICEGTTTTGV